MELTGARIGVTGATGGVGMALCRRLLDGGAEVVACGRDERALATLADDLGVTTICADLTDAGAVGGLAAQLADLDAVVVNAAVWSPTTGQDPLDDVARAMVEVNLVAPVVIAEQFVARHVTTGRPGSLVFIGSIAGFAASPTSAVYGATKFGVRGFALGFAQQVRGTPVTVSHVAPGHLVDAGVLVRSGRRPPPGAGTTTTVDVADAVADVLRTGRAEVIVAPWHVRIGVRLMGLSPRLSARVGALAARSDDHG